MTETGLNLIHETLDVFSGKKVYRQGVPVKAELQTINTMVAAINNALDAMEYSTDGLVTTTAKIKAAMMIAGVRDRS